MKIGVLYIALGAYSVMWKDFFLSSKAHFFVGHDIHYFVFTDSTSISGDEYVTVIPTKNFGWPGNTLYRFRFFLQIKEQMKEFDYIYFLNANALFVQDVGEDALPDETGLVSDAHPIFLNKPLWKAAFERRRKSTAFVDWGCEGPAYVQACFFGAQSQKMIQMCEILSENIAIDEANGVCAVWHDESHFNCFVSKNGCKILPPLYACPESIDLSCYGQPKIIMRNKENFGDLNKLRYGRQLSFCGRAKKKAKTLVHHLGRLFVEWAHLPRFYRNRKRNPWATYRLDKVNDSKK